MVLYGGPTNTGMHPAMNTSLSRRVDGESPARHRVIGSGSRTAFDSFSSGTS